jgi:hypothetical protein
MVLGLGRVSATQVTPSVCRTTVPKIVHRARDSPLGDALHVAPERRTNAFVQMVDYSVKEHALERRTLLSE